MTTDCVEWHMRKDRDGYGRVDVNHRPLLAHRVAYAKHHGLEISALKGLVIRHKCDNRSCVNPLHLELGTRFDKMERLARKAELMRGYSKIHSERHAARRALRTAIEAGRINPQPCAVCGHQDVEGHHVAYDMPLDVVWLCKPHHQQLHKEARTKEAA